MKYRRLTIEELTALEKEFVHFLIINGIDADGWETMKKSEPGKSDQLIDIFSDMIFEGIISKVKYIEYFDHQGLKLFRCDDDKIMLSGIVAPMAFSTVEDLMAHLDQNRASYQIYHTSKPYFPTRHEEIFNMINSGALVTDGQYFEYFINI